MKSPDVSAADDVSGNGAADLGTVDDLNGAGDSLPLKEKLDRLLETIAWEELALAALIHAEAEKIQAVVEAGLLGPVDADDVEQLNLAVARVIEIVVQKEEMLRKKLYSLLALKERRLT